MGNRHFEKVYGPCYCLTVHNETWDKYDISIWNRLNPNYSLRWDGVDTRISEIRVGTKFGEYTVIDITVSDDLCIHYRPYKKKERIVILDDDMPELVIPPTHKKLKIGRPTKL